MKRSIFTPLPTYETRYGTYEIYTDSRGYYFAFNPTIRHFTYDYSDLGHLLTYLSSDQNWGNGLESKG